MTAPARSELLRPFYPALDGLRAIAFLAVFVHHHIYPFYPRYRFLDWGWAGVDLFFVLSGFLITGILFDTLDRPDFFRNFYIRRALRIFPLFYGIWLFLLLLTPVLHISWTRANFAMAAYVGNFLTASARVHHWRSPSAIFFFFHGVRSHFSMGHLWSLCVEEQFYLVWPAVVWFLRTRKALLRVCLAVIVIVPFARAVYGYYQPEMLAASHLYFATWSRLDTLLCGAAIALWLRGANPSMAKMRVWLTAIAPATLVLLLVGQHFFGIRGIEPAEAPFVNIIGFTLIAVGCSALLILALEPGTWFARMLQIKPLVYLGRISYGMYVIHYIFFSFLFDHRRAFAGRHVTFLVPIFSFLLTLVLASLSFHFLESPFLSLKSRLAPRGGAVDDPAPAPSALRALVEGPSVVIE